ncbi:MAG: alpha/beta hydrolase family protein [Armatimonadota bacterium]
MRTNQQGSDFKPPATRKEWLARRQELREQILVSCGLYPLPPKTPLNARVYGKIEREGYTVEKVVLETLPGFFLSGNLYRPAAVTGKVPGILNPHGHWGEGRFNADVQARCAGQARMGAIAFQYDMVGYGDSAAFGHAFMDPELAAIGMNLPGLQLWNSIRALDWLLSLPEVDPARVACTGESGGGTQTFLLSAVDERVRVAAPVCMVSHHFQGGCSCENAPLLRIGTDNVEFAAMVAPRPQILIGATGDWTSQIMEKGEPEIRAVYRLFGAEDRLDAVVHKADHNYNQASRESVYTFFRKHLWGEKQPEPVKEATFVPELETAISTWSAEHPRPDRALNPARLKGFLRGVVDEQVQALAPRSREQWRGSREVLETGLRTALQCELPAPGAVKASHLGPAQSPPSGASGVVMTLGREGESGVREALWLAPVEQKLKAVTVVVHPGGWKAAREDATLKPLISGLIGRGQAVLLLDTFLGGQPEAARQRQSSQYYTTYNKPVLAQRVQDVLNGVAYAQAQAKELAGGIDRVNLLGVGEAGPLVLLARPFAGKIRRTAADTAGFEWTTDMPVNHPMALPAALRYGGMRSYLALSAPQPLYLFNAGETPSTAWVREVYALEGSRALELSNGPAEAGALEEWLAPKN